MRQAMNEWGGDLAAMLGFVAFVAGTLGWITLAEAAFT